MNARTSFFAAASLLSLATFAGIAKAGPVVWSTADGGNGHAYEVIIDDTISWTAARAAAGASSRHLATIGSSGEQSFIEQLLTDAGAPTGSYWHGLNETSTEGAFAWDNGDPLSFLNWAAGEPNNANGVENRGGILWTKEIGDGPTFSRRGGWNDYADSGYPNATLTPAQADVLRGGYIVESDNPVAAVPLPAALYAFPLGAAVAAYSARRIKRGK